MYEVPFFATNRVLSNEMCMILVKLLHDNPKHRFRDLAELKLQLLQLRENIFETPQLLRMVLRHPILPGEKLETLDNDTVVDFRGMGMDKFSLKYLAKFICEFDIQSICINGSFDRPMPIRAIQHNQLISLNLKDTGLYSEDLFIISQVLKDNSSLKEMNLSKNMIGFTYMDESRLIELKRKS